jgi:DNA-binding IclR family transcriptional regulator
MIGSVQRALDILELFDAQTSELGTTEIAAATGLHKSTVAGLIYTLEAKGYLNQNPATRKYRLGLKLVERASIMLGHVEIRQVALPHIQALRDEFDETVNLAILDGADVVYVERLLSKRGLGMRSEVGKRMLAHSTALGKAILSCWPVDQVKNFIKQYGLPAVTPNTITDPERLLCELDRTREQGYAMDDEENEPGGRCVAAPIFDHMGQVVAAVSLSAPSPRMPSSQVSSVGLRVKEIAKAISCSLGYSPRLY